MKLYLKFMRSSGKVRNQFIKHQIKQNQIQFIKRLVYFLRN